MTKQEKAVLDFLRSGNEFSETAIVARVRGSSFVQTPMVLTALEAKELVRLKMENRGRFYSITPKGLETLNATVAA